MHSADHALTVIRDHREVTSNSQKILGKIVKVQKANNGSESQSPIETLHQVNPHPTSRHQIHSAVCNFQTAF